MPYALGPVTRSRTRLLLGLATLLSAGCGGARPSDPEPPSRVQRADLQGTWRGLDTLTYVVEDGVSGDSTVFRILQRRVTIADSMWTDVSVSQTGEEEIQGYRTASAFQIRGDSIGPVRPTDDASWQRLSIRGDTLVIENEALRDRSEARWVRAGAPTVLPALLGLWVGLSEPDAAGVPAEIGFRFRADGVYENGWGEESGQFEALGPYLLLDDVDLTPEASDGGLTFVRLTVLRLEVQADGVGPDRLVLSGASGSGASPLVLYRR